ncbi:hypothetical protein [Emticicia agri]|uniref:Uncharacterized protein n=1 Tax=Emticicia agri TaxID=2492393 RepID=A0A4V1ZCT8_9BACT|nr:hypothetical protein [Emticicia agri]RYU93810.1 hypothetical protein EWM59_20020 [Emticicia agri]
MADLITIGLAKIEVGNKGVNDAMGTTLAVIGNTAEGSCTIETSDPEITEFFVEEKEGPIHTAIKQGQTTISFQLAAPDLAQCEAVFGGEYDEEDDTWTYPVSAVAIEKSVKITPKEGLIFAIPRARISAKFTGQFGRSDTLKVEVTILVLQPANNAPSMTLSLVA